MYNCHNLIYTTMLRTLSTGKNTFYIVQLIFYTLDIDKYHSVKYKNITM